MKYKPFNLNFYTMIFFLLPIILGIQYNCIIISKGTFLIFIIGLLYHSTYIKILNILDKTTIIVCLIYFLINGITYTIYFVFTNLCALFLLLGYKYLSYSENGIIYHSLIHFISSMGIVFLILGCNQEKCKLQIN